ncbi:MAG: hypothetical protein KDC44_24200 [Phaeodactylibacter sp.]|nr:hypothetical protein [Phaeodactylibacter sp.]
MIRIILSAFMLVLLASCGGTSAEDKAAEEQLLQEAATLDSLSTELESTQMEIKEAAENLDNILDEL